MPRSFEFCIFFKDSQPKSRMNFSPCVQHSTPKIFFFIWSTKYLPKTPNHVAHLDAILSSSLILHLFFISTLFSNTLSPCPAMSVKKIRTQITQRAKLQSCLYRASMTIKTLYYSTDAQIYNSWIQPKLL
jgi:hypothetical protein